MDLAKLHWLPIGRIAEVNRFLDGLVFEATVYVFDLVDQVLFEDRVDCVVRPAEATRPKHQGVEPVLAVPALFRRPMQHGPLAGQRDVMLVAQLALEDELALVLRKLRLSFTIFDQLLSKLPHLHPFLDDKLVVHLESTLHSVEHWAVLEVQALVEADLTMRHLRFAFNPSEQLVPQRRRDALVARQVQTYDTSCTGQRLADVPKHVLGQVRLADVQMDQCFVSLDHRADILHDGLLLHGVGTPCVLLLEQELVVAVDPELPLLRSLI